MLLLLHLPASLGTCGHALADQHGAFWAMNLTGLHRAADVYVKLLDNTRIAVNFCSPTLQICLPVSPSGRGPELVRGAATRLWGDLPATGSQCHLANDQQQLYPIQCTQPCEVLGAGALGVSGGDWGFVDEADPRQGFRVTHSALPTPPANQSAVAAGRLDAPAAWRPPCGMDGIGNPLPRRVVFQLVCDRGAQFTPVVDSPAELTEADAEARCETPLRVRTAAACFDFRWVAAAWGPCQQEVPNASLSMRRRAVECGADGTTSKDARYCDAPARPPDFEFCAPPQQAAAAAAAAAAPRLPEVVYVQGGANAWEQAAAICSALSLLGLLLGALLVLPPPAVSRLVERARGADAADDDDREPFAYEAPRAGVHYNAF